MRADASLVDASRLAGAWLDRRMIRCGTSAASQPGGGDSDVDAQHQALRAGQRPSQVCLIPASRSSRFAGTSGEDVDRAPAMHGRGWGVLGTAEAGLTCGYVTIARRAG